MQRRSSRAACSSSTARSSGCRRVREALKRLTGESLVYGLGQVSGRAVQLLLVPVLTRQLSQGAFGVAELVAAYLQTAALVLVFGMDGALARFFYQEPDRAARVRMVSTSFAFRAVIVSAAALAAALLAAPLAGGLLGSAVYHKYLLLGAAILPCTRTLEEVASYAVAMKFCSVVSMSVAAFQLAYGPFAFARAHSPEAPRLFARVLSAYIALASLGALAAAVFAPEILAVLVPAAYRDAARPAVWLAFAAVAQGAYTVVSIGIGLALRTSLLGWPAGGAALLAVAANVLLVPRWGAAGAGVATTLGYAASAALAYRAAQRVHPLPYRGARAAAVWAGALLLALVIQRAAPAGAAGVALKLAVLAAFAAVIVRPQLGKQPAAP